MGSWNGTCFLTNLPIMSGDPVYLQMIVMNDFFDINKAGEMRTHANEEWHLLGFPVQAEYNDYGWIKNPVESDFTEDLFKKIADSLFERELGENEYRDHEVKKNMVSWKKLGDWLHSGRLLFKNRYGAKYGMVQLPVSFFLMHKEAYDNIVSHPLSNYEETDVYQNNYDRAKEYIETHNKFRNDLSPEASLRKMLRDDALSRGENMAFARVFAFSDQDYDVESLATAIARMHHFLTMTELLRKTFFPMSGNGSQSEELDLYKMLANTTTSIIKKFEDKYSEYE